MFSISNQPKEMRAGYAAIVVVALTFGCAHGYTCDPSLNGADNWYSCTSSQFGSVGECHNGVCNCPAGMVLFGNKCQKIGDPCDTTCVKYDSNELYCVESVFCADFDPNKCMTAPRTIKGSGIKNGIIIGTCDCELRPSADGTTCSNTQITQGGQCSSGVCQCGSGTVLSGTSCVTPLSACTYVDNNVPFVSYGEPCYISGTTVGKCWRDGVCRSVCTPGQVVTNTFGQTAECASTGLEYCTLGNYHHLCVNFGQECVATAATPAQSTLPAGTHCGLGVYAGVLFDNGTCSTPYSCMSTTIDCSIFPCKCNTGTLKCQQDKTCYSNYGDSNDLAIIGRQYYRIDGKYEICDNMRSSRHDLSTFPSIYTENSITRSDISSECYSSAIFYGNTDLNGLPLLANDATKCAQGLGTCNRTARCVCGTNAKPVIASTSPFGIAQTCIECDQSYIYNNYIGACMLTCSTDSQCDKSSTCFGGECTCVASIGAPKPAYVLTKFNELNHVSACTCGLSGVAVRGKCLTKDVIDKDCGYLGAPTICKENVWASYNEGICIQKNITGGVCHTNTFQDGHCVKGVCSQCLPKSENCIENTDGTTVCDATGTCVAPIYSMKTDDNVWKCPSGTILDTERMSCKCSNISHVLYIQTYGGNPSPCKIPSKITCGGCNDTDIDDCTAPFGVVTISSDANGIRVAKCSCDSPRIVDRDGGVCSTSMVKSGGVCNYGSCECRTQILYNNVCIDSGVVPCTCSDADPTDCTVPKRFVTASGSYVGGNRLGSCDCSPVLRTGDCINTGYTFEGSFLPGICVGSSCICQESMVYYNGRCVSPGVSCDCPDNTPNDCSTMRGTVINAGIGMNGLPIGECVDCQFVSARSGQNCYDYNFYGKGSCSGYSCTCATDHLLYGSVTVNGVTKHNCSLLSDPCIPDDTNKRDCLVPSVGKLRIGGYVSGGMLGICDTLEYKDEVNGATCYRTASEVNGVCYAGKCRCPDTYALYGTTCVAVNSNCAEFTDANPNDCFAPANRIKYGALTANGDYIGVCSSDTNGTSGNKCAMSLADSASLTGICNSGTCACPPNYKLYNDKCVAINSVCYDCVDTDNDCYRNSGKYVVSTVTSGAAICTCNTNTLRSAGVECDLDRETAGILDSSESGRCTSSGMCTCQTTGCVTLDDSVFVCRLCEKSNFGTLGWVGRNPCSDCLTALQADATYYTSLASTNRARIVVVNHKIRVFDIKYTAGGFAGKIPAMFSTLDELRDFTIDTIGIVTGRLSLDNAPMINNIRLVNTQLVGVLPTFLWESTNIVSISLLNNIFISGTLPTDFSAMVSLTSIDIYHSIIGGNPDFFTTRASVTTVKLITTLAICPLTNPIHITTYACAHKAALCSGLNLLQCDYQNTGCFQCQGVCSGSQLDGFVYEDGICMATTCTVPVVRCDPCHTERYIADLITNECVCDYANVIASAEGDECIADAKIKGNCDANALCLSPDVKFICDLCAKTTIGSGTWSPSNPCDACSTGVLNDNEYVFVPATGRRQATQEVTKIVVSGRRITSLNFYPDINFVGVIPDTINLVAALNQLIIVSPNLVGQIPQTITQLKNIHTITLRGSLSGEIPVGVWTMQSLSVIDISGNTMLHGHIPSDISSSITVASAQSCVVMDGHWTPQLRSECCSQYAVAECNSAATGCAVIDGLCLGDGTSCACSGTCDQPSGTVTAVDGQLQCVCQQIIDGTKFCSAPGAAIPLYCTEGGCSECSAQNGNMFCAGRGDGKLICSSALTCVEPARALLSTNGAWVCPENSAFDGIASCVCKSGMLFYDNVCTLITTDICECPADTQCTKTFRQISAKPGTGGIEGYCACTNVKLFDVPCTIDEASATPDGTCNNGNCYCAGTTVLFEGRCVEPGTGCDCQNDVQNDCIGVTKTVLDVGTHIGMCKCDEYALTDGAGCDVNAQKTGMQAGVCASGSCVCQTGYLLFDGACVELGTPCTTPLQPCSGVASCYASGMVSSFKLADDGSAVCTCDAAKPLYASCRFSEFSEVGGYCSATKTCMSPHVKFICDICDSTNLAQLSITWTPPDLCNVCITGVFASSSYGITEDSSIGIIQTDGQAITSFHIANQYLSGSLPDSFALLESTSLIIIIGGKQLTGSVPPSVSALANVHTLTLTGNFEGTIPSSIWSLEYLEHLSLAGNMGIHGQFPESLSSSLTYIDISDTCIYGSPSDAIVSQLSLFRATNTLMTCLFNKPGLTCSRSTTCCASFSESQCTADTGCFLCDGTCSANTCYCAGNTVNYQGICVTLSNPTTACTCANDIAGDCMKSNSIVKTADGHIGYCDCEQLPVTDHNECNAGFCKSGVCQPCTIAGGSQCSDDEHDLKYCDGSACVAPKNSILGADGIHYGPVDSILSPDKSKYTCISGKLFDIDAAVPTCVDVVGGCVCPPVPCKSVSLDMTQLSTNPDFGACECVASPNTGAACPLNGISNSGVCLETGACVECFSDTHCDDNALPDGNGKTYCNVESSVCECPGRSYMFDGKCRRENEPCFESDLPTSNDVCPGDAVCYSSGSKLYHLAVDNGALVCICDTNNQKATNEKCIGSETMFCTDDARCVTDGAVCSAPDTCFKTNTAPSGACAVDHECRYIKSVCTEFFQVKPSPAIMCGDNDFSIPVVHPDDSGWSCLSERRDDPCWRSLAPEYYQNALLTSANPITKTLFGRLLSQRFCNSASGKCDIAPDCDGNPCTVESPQFSSSGHTIPSQCAPSGTGLTDCPLGTCADGCARDPADDIVFVGPLFGKTDPIITPARSNGKILKAAVPALYDGAWTYTLKTLAKFSYPTFAVIAANTSAASGACTIAVTTTPLGAGPFTATIAAKLPASFPDTSPVRIPLKINEITTEMVQIKFTCSGAVGVIVSNSRSCADDGDCLSGGLCISSRCVFSDIAIYNNMTALLRGTKKACATACSACYGRADRKDMYDRAAKGLTVGAAECVACGACILRTRYNGNVNARGEVVPVVMTECDDKNPCTQDLCADETCSKCEHSAIASGTVDAEHGCSVVTCDNGVQSGHRKAAVRNGEPCPLIPDSDHVSGMQMHYRCRNGRCRRAGLA